MFHKANLISICLSFYPFKKRMSIIRYSKKLQKVQGININYYQLLFSFNSSSAVLASTLSISPNNEVFFDNI